MRKSTGAETLMTISQHQPARMTASEIREACASLFGDDAEMEQRAATFIGVNKSTLHRWLAGVADVPPTASLAIRSLRLLQDRGIDPRRALNYPFDPQDPTP